MLNYFYTHFPKQFGIFLNFILHVAHPFKLFLFKLNFEVYFSGKQQDKWIINEVFKKKKNLFFVDLSATSGIIDNNTYVLEKKYNWKGIAFEPNPIFLKRLKKNRNCKISNLIISDKNHMVKFLYNGGIGGIVGKNYDNNYDNRKKLIFKKKDQIQKVSTVTLKNALDSLKSKKIIHFLSLDIEGAEYNALKNFDFKKYKILSIIIERCTKKLHNVLIKNNFIFIKNYKVDGFYVHNDLQNKIKLKTQQYQPISKKEW
jgi:FkbM family methyltransferase